MKPISFFIILFLFPFNLSAQEYKESELPTAVLSSFKDKFTPQGKVNWVKNASIFSASLKTNDQTVIADFSDDGKWIDTKYMMDEKELPSEIISYITTSFKDAKIKEASIRESPNESDQYYLILKKEKTTSVAELFFDIKSNFIKQNVSDEFINAGLEIENTIAVPAAVLATFKTKLPDAIISTWKTEGSFYTATFVNEEMNGRAEFTSEGTWNFTKYTISEKELPGSAMSNYKISYSKYKIKTCEMVQEPATADHYYVFAKKDGINQPSVELYYSMTGKLIKKVSSEDNDKTEDNIDEDSDTSTDAVGTSQVITTKELPSPAISYIKKTYYGYVIKEALMITEDETTTYSVNIKKEGKKAIIELTFDMNGKCLTKEEEKN